MKDFKLEEGQNIDDVVKGIIRENGWVEGKTANAIPLERGDIFTIIGVEKPNFGNSSTNSDFQAITVKLSNGATVGIRHFNKCAIELMKTDDTIPPLGRKIEECVKWALVVSTKETEFRCKSVSDGDEKTDATGRKYIPKKYTIELN